MQILAGCRCVGQRAACGHSCLVPPGPDAQPLPGPSGASWAGAGRAPSRDPQGGGCWEQGTSGGPVPDDHSGKEPNLEESLRGGTERDEGGTRGDASGVRSCKVRLVGGRLRLVLRGPRRGRNRIGGRKLQGGMLGSV